MHQTRSLMFKRLTSPRFRLGCLTLALLVCLVSFCLVFVSLPAHSSTGHGCAPDAPPPVAATPTLAPATKGSVEINEVLTQPESTWNCSEASGTYSIQMDSWVELYNATNQSLDLYTPHAQLSLDGGTTWYQLPLGSIIAPLKFLVIFPLEQKSDSQATWNVVLKIGGTTIDQVTIPALEPDQSYARIPDGTGSWQLVGQPTIDASNNTSNLPITPTPTKTPKPTPTPRPSPTSKAATTQDGNARTGTGTQTPATTGTQPAWNEVQLPPGTSNPSAAHTSPSQLLEQPRNAGTTQSNRPGGGQVLLIGAVLVLLLAALIWCWRAFRAP